MKPLSAMELLSVWEHGLSRAMLDRALILVAAASPELDLAGAASLSIGQRDARLMELREWLFGSRLVNTAVCPQCSERVEWENDLNDIRVQPPHSVSSPDTFDLKVEEYQLQFRLPNSMDVVEVMENILAKDRHSLIPQEADFTAADPASMDLLNHCIVEAEHRGKRCGIDELPKFVLDALSRQITKLDPQAEVRIDLTCPTCSHHWAVLFDIAGFLWVEINAWAERMLQTVHRLACAYGWTEQEILSLSPVRRQLYLGMANS